MPGAVMYEMWLSKVYWSFLSMKRQLCKGTGKERAVEIYDRGLFLLPIPLSVHAGFDNCEADMFAQLFPSVAT